MDWDRDLPGWPLSDLSRRIDLAPHRWHVQETGRGPTLLLLHGAGASTHSWRELIPFFAAGHHVVALDLPGQGFTQAGRGSRFGLDTMTRDIAALCRAEGWAPSAIIGHSAGACVALCLSLTLRDSRGDPPDVVGINAALGRFEGVAGWLFPILAKLLALNPLTALVFSASPNPLRRATRLIEGTGSRLGPDGLQLYAKLLSDRAHVDGTLRMMAQWDTLPLLDQLTKIRSRCLLLAADGDQAVSADVSARAAAQIPGAELSVRTGLGHLMHEEDPRKIAEDIIHWLARRDDVPGSAAHQ